MKFGIIFGGQSYEHEISIVSAIAVKNVLKRDLTFIFCDARREFYLIPAAQIKVARGYFCRKADFIRTDYWALSA